VNEADRAEIAATQTVVTLCLWQDIEAEADEMWSFVGSKKVERWLRHAIDPTTGVGLA
jgi:insertion element IS1 protein InsB